MISQGWPQPSSSCAVESDFNIDLRPLLAVSSYLTTPSGIRPVLRGYASHYLWTLEVRSKANACLGRIRRALSLCREDAPVANLDKPRNFKQPEKAYRHAIAKLKGKVRYETILHVDSCLVSSLEPIRHYESQHLRSRTMVVLVIGVDRQAVLDSSLGNCQRHLAMAISPRHACSNCRHQRNLSIL